jgi:4-hydroxyphenylacetate 3-monooxygenase
VATKEKRMPARTGQEYLQGLQRRQRDIWLGGERVADVTTAPALANCAHTLARLYDMQHTPGTQAVLTYVSPETGQREATSFIIPRSIDDLQRRREMVKTWADATCGMMGRTPDFLNINLMGFAVRPDYFARNQAPFGENIVRYYEYVRDHDLCLTHTLVNPQIDRAKQVTELDPYIGLGVVDETGLITARAPMTIPWGRVSTRWMRSPCSRTCWSPGSGCFSTRIPPCVTGFFRILAPWRTSCTSL